MQKPIKAIVDNRSVMTFCMALLFIFILSFSVSAYDECKSKQPADQVPCLVLLPSTSCSNISISFYNGTTYLQNTNMTTYSPFVCSAAFNFTALGTYNFNYSTGDSGSIVVTEGSTMINLLYFAIVLVVGLMILGLWLNNQPILAIDGFLMLILGIWMFVNGYSIYNNMITQMIAGIFCALGGYFLTMSTLSMIEGDSE